MKLQLRSLLPVAALALSAASLNAADAVELKQQWLTGKKYHQTMEMAQTSTIAMGPQTMDQKVNMTMEMSTAVTKHDDGSRKRLVVRYDRMAMKMDMNGQQMGFDSAKPEDDPTGMGKGMGAIVGKELRILASPKDEILEIENYDEFVAAAAGPGAAMMGKMFSKDSLTDMVKQGSLKALPPNAVKPGDSWAFDYAMKLPQIGSVGVKGTYTFKGMKPHDGIPSAEITMDATMNIDMSGAGAGDKEKDPAAAMIAAMGMKLTSGKMNGTIYFDPALGMARDMQMTQEMEMSMNNPAQPDAKITIPMKQNISMKLTKIEDIK
jgi:hypothetical protein